jgi:hypothetical protein
MRNCEPDLSATWVHFNAFKFYLSNSTVLFYTDDCHVLYEATIGVLFAMCSLFNHHQSLVYVYCLHAVLKKFHRFYRPTYTLASHSALRSSASCCMLIITVALFWRSLFTRLICRLAQFDGNLTCRTYKKRGVWCQLFIDDDSTVCSRSCSNAQV